MSKIFDTYLFKYTVFCVLCVVLLYNAVSASPAWATIVFTILGAWKVGEWIAKVGDILVTKFHGGSND
jgi:hypothetical protein